MTLPAFILSGLILVALALMPVLRALLGSRAALLGETFPKAARTAALLALGVPLAATALYAALGSPAGLILADATTPAPIAPGREPALPSGTSPAPTGPARIGPEQIEAMVQRLTDRLKQQPDDVEGWRMLARSSETLGRFDRAAEAYGQMERLRPLDADVLTDHAVALAMSLDRRLTGGPEKLIQQALQLDPRNVQALALAGSAAYERGELAQAVAQWRKIIALVPEGDPMATTLRESIRQAEALAAERATRPAN